MTIYGKICETASGQSAIAKLPNGKQWERWGQLTEDKETEYTTEAYYVDENGDTLEVTVICEWEN